MDTTWDLDSRIVAAAWSAFAAAIRYTMNGMHGGLPPALVPYLHQVEVLAQDFESEPEKMGTASATLWQDRAVELSRPNLSGLSGQSKTLVEMAVQIAALVFHAARRQGGERNCEFGYAYGFVRADLRDGKPKLDLDLFSFHFEPLDMLEFVYLRAAALDVPAEELARKKARRGLGAAIAAAPAPVRGPRADTAPWPLRQRRLIQAALELRGVVMVGFVDGKEVAIAHRDTVAKIKAFDAACADLEEGQPS
jgi:hypothetical protein